MATVILTETTFQPDEQYAGTVPRVRGWYDRSFIAGDGITPVVAGNGQVGFYLDEACSLNVLGELVVPALTLQCTNQSNPTARFFLQLYTQGLSPTVPLLIPGWSIPAQFGSSVNFAQLAVYNRAKRLVSPPNTYLTADDTILLINQTAGIFNFAGVGMLGRTQLDVAPVDSSHPIAIGANNPRMPPLTTPVYWASQYPSFNAAVASIGSAKATLIVSEVMAATTVSIPSTLTLVFMGAGGLTITTGNTITIVSQIMAGQVKIFFNALAGQGTVSLVGSIEPKISPMWWGAVVDGATSDQTPWTATIAAAYTAKVAHIHMPAGISIVTSLVFPAYSSAGNEGISITIEGIGQPPTEAGSFPGTLQVSTRSSIIKSTTASTAGVLTQAGSPFQAVSLTLKNLIIRREDNPTGPGVDWANGFGLYLENVIIDTGKYTTAVTQPTNPAGIGIVTPGASNAGSQSIRGDSWIQGYFSGLSAGEHFTQSGHLAISACAEGLLLPAGGQIHAVSFTRLHLYNNTTNIRVEGTANLNISVCNIEHANGGGVPLWQETVWDIDDANNVARGFMLYNVNKAFVGLDSTFTRNGGFFIGTRELRYGQQWHTNVSHNVSVSIPDNTDTLLSFNTASENTALADLSTASRIKPTQYGAVLLIAQIRFAANATGIRAVRIWKHDGQISTDLLVAISQETNLGGTFMNTLALTTEAVASHPDDYFFVTVLQNSGGALNSIATTVPDVTSPRFIMHY